MGGDWCGEQDQEEPGWVGLAGAGPGQGVDNAGAGSRQGWLGCMCPVGFHWLRGLAGMPVVSPCMSEHA